MCVCVCVTVCVGGCHCACENAVARSTVAIIVVVAAAAFAGTQLMYAVFSSLSSAEMYNPISNQWTVLQSLTTPRRGLGVAAIGGALYAAGGHDGKSYLNAVEKYNKYSQGWAVVGHLVDCRGRFGFA